jgi:DNA (cytosine-5)-methyltransferase 1
MTAYYNEIDPKAAAWLRELILQGHIAPGDVDERSIVDVTAKDLLGYIQCHFFAGIGVWSYALRQAGFPDDREVWTGSCPCQPFSTAGKGKGIEDERHLFPELHRLITERQPELVFGEQVGSKAGIAWLDDVQLSLENSGYTCGAVTFPACSIGSPHIRPRIYWMGYSEREGLQRQFQSKKTKEDRPTKGRSDTSPGICNGFWSDFEIAEGNGYSKPVQPGTFPLAYESPERVGRLRGYGNAIVAEQAQIFIETALEVIL